MKSRNPMPEYSGESALKNHAPCLNDVHQAALTAVIQELTIRKYSWRTIKSYRSHLALFFAFFAEKNPESIQDEEVGIYLSRQVMDRNWAEATQQQALNAVLFYFVHILGRHPDFNGLRPKTSAKLPTVLGGAEIAAIFRAVVNVKHRSMLMLIYSAGLSLSELTNMRLADIQFDRKRVFVRGGKSKNDRYSLLSEKMAASLREYFCEYRTREWLFEGREGGPYSGRSVEAVFQRAMQKAGIRTFATVRTLRHSFAVHLVEQGAGIHYIQEILGHESLKTTSIYNYLAHKANQRMNNPLDGLDC